MKATALPREAQRWRFYRAVWRWHFYAGLLVLPFIVWLAVTGAVYVYQKPIDRWVHHALKVVPVAASAVPVSAQIEAVRTRSHGDVFRYTLPERPDGSAEIGVMAHDGHRMNYYVDPGSGRVLGHLPEKGTFSGVVRRLHSLDLLGDYASALIEMAAGWSILLVLTGLYLWWPRGRNGGVSTVRGRPGQRLFWRDLHAVTGAWVGLALLFLALTGMPWSVVWGSQVNRLANGHGYGYPAGVRVSVPMSAQRLDATSAPTWSLQQARLPVSAVPHAQHDHPAGQADHAAHEEHGGGALGDLSPQPGAIGIDAAVARFHALGLAPGYSVALPRGPTGVYTGSVYPEQLAQQRVVHLDQYSGGPLLDMSYADYGPLGRGLEWGINVHLGQQYGTFNRVLLILACLLILVVCLSGAVMWWKRRPVGGLGVPPLPPRRRAVATVFALLCIGGLLFPLVGLSLLLVGLLDFIASGGWRSTSAAPH